MVSKKLFKIKNTIVRWWKNCPTGTVFSSPYHCIFDFEQFFWNHRDGFKKTVQNQKYNGMVMKKLCQWDSFFITVLWYFWFWTVFLKPSEVSTFFFREIPQSRKINQNIHKARSESKYLLRFVVNLLLFKAKNWFGRLTMRILKIFLVVQIGGSSKGVLATGIIFPSGHFLRWNQLKKDQILTST